MTSLDEEIVEITEFGPLVRTSDGSYTVRHGDHGQDFHSSEGAKFEAWNLYVLASGYKDTLRMSNGPDIRILDVGMGLGYNAAATIAAWLESDGTVNVNMTSLEIDRRLVEALIGGKAPWQRGWSSGWLMGPKLLIAESGSYRALLKHPKSDCFFSWKIEVGDAFLKDLTSLEFPFDFIWQDPFTPELNPVMWSKNWFTKLREVASQKTILVTYSVARVVKDALSEAGWHHRRFPTPGKKRHWLQATILRSAD